MLGGSYRALDLTDEKGAFCGQILADLGVDVIKVEPVGGSPERRLGPFFRDEPNSETGAYWLAHNCNKRSITLNLHAAEGRDLFRRLVNHADFVIESFAPGYMESLGLAYEALSRHNPRLIVTSITPFGQSGPYAHFASTDLTILALGGLLNLNGDADRAPLRFAIEQSFPQAGAQAAAATMIAHQFRAITGIGQHVDISMQEAVCQTIWLEQYFWQIERTIMRREGVRCQRGDVFLRLVFPCQDGYVSWRIFVAHMGAKTKALVDWMTEEGGAGPLVTVDWSALDMDKLEQTDVDEWEEWFSAFFRKHTKKALHEESVRRGIMLFPMNDVPDLLADQQLAWRAFWNEVDHPALGKSIRYPGRPYQSPGIIQEQKKRPPLIGEHNQEIYGDELGLSPTDLRLLGQAGVI